MKCSIPLIAICAAGSALANPLNQHGRKHAQHQHLHHAHDAAHRFGNHSAPHLPHGTHGHAAHAAHTETSTLVQPAEATLTAAAAPETAAADLVSYSSADGTLLAISPVTDTVTHAVLSTMTYTMGAGSSASVTTTQYVVTVTDFVTKYVTVIASQTPGSPQPTGTGSDASAASAVSPAAANGAGSYPTEAATSNAASAAALSDASSSVAATSADDAVSSDAALSSYAAKSASSVASIPTAWYGNGTANATRPAILYAAVKSSSKKATSLKTSTSTKKASTSTSKSSVKSATSSSKGANDKLVSSSKVLSQSSSATTKKSSSSSSKQATTSSKTSSTSVKQAVASSKTSSSSSKAATTLSKTSSTSSKKTSATSALSTTASSKAAKATTPSKSSTPNKVVVKSTSAQASSSSQAQTAAAPAATGAGTVSGCTEWYVAQSGDYCYLIAQKFDLNVNTFMAWNPSVNAPSCSSLYAGYAYCVATLTSGSSAASSSVASVAASSAATSTVQTHSSSAAISTYATSSAYVASSTSAAASATSTGSGTYHQYSGDGSVSAGWPAQSAWLDFETLWSVNQHILTSSCTQFGVANNSPDELTDMKSVIQSVASEFDVDERFILAIILQESGGCTRVWTTNYGVSNPGLMQDHDGKGTCNSGSEASPNPTTPCPQSEIEMMITEGTNGTVATVGAANGGDGLVQSIAKSQKSSSDVARFYAGAHIYNGGSAEYNPNDMNSGCCTACYASDVANRLTGWATGEGSPCTLTTSD